MCPCSRLLPFSNVSLGYTQLPVWSVLKMIDSQTIIVVQCMLSSQTFRPQIFVLQKSVWYVKSGGVIEIY